MPPNESDHPSDLQAQLESLGGSFDAVVPAVDSILAEAVRREVSDVHFEPTPDHFVIRMRMDGVIRSMASLPSALAPNVIARLKVMSDLLTYRVDVPQEGAIRQDMWRFADMRVSTFPTVHGEKAVVRIFQAAKRLLQLEDLNFEPELLATLNRLLNERSGSILLTGPSGSGKTTTIYACLRRILQDGSGRHIVTIEDPVEQLVAGVSQSQARPGTEFDFARGLRSLLRQDPDVIVVGEIRDRETAAVATEAALTGHLVFSTLHAGSACGVVGRLLDMGVEPFLLTSSIKGVLNQRLLRSVCTTCHAGSNNSGCASCGGSGYRGRFLVAELLTFDSAFRKAVLAKADVEVLESIAARSGLQTIRDAANAAIRAGRTTQNEVDRVLGAEHGQSPCSGV